MRKRHAREIRKGVLHAREEVRAKRDDDFERICINMWGILDLKSLALKAHNRTYRKGWRNLK